MMSNVLLLCSNPMRLGVPKADMEVSEQVDTYIKGLQGDKPVHRCASCSPLPVCSMPTSINGQTNCNLDAVEMRSPSPTHARIVRLQHSRGQQRKRRHEVHPLCALLGLQDIRLRTGHPHRGHGHPRRHEGNSSSSPMSIPAVAYSLANVLILIKLLHCALMMTDAPCCCWWIPVAGGRGAHPPRRPVCRGPRRRQPQQLRKREAHHRDRKARRRRGRLARLVSNAAAAAAAASSSSSSTVRPALRL